MAKLIALAIIAWLIYKIVKHYARHVDHPDKRKTPASEVMVQCNTCGVHLPISESQQSGERYYCCEEHRQQGQP